MTTCSLPLLRLFRALTLPLLLLPIAVHLQAQKKEPEPAGREILRIPVRVEREPGAFWLDGKRQNFRAAVDEREAAVRSLLGPASSTIFLVVFDTVADITRVEIARNAVAERIKDLEPNYWLGLMKSQDALGVIQEPTADKSALDVSLAQVKVQGKAGLLDTLEQVSSIAQGMMQKAGVRVSILYISDSGIGNYRADYLNPVINSSDAGDLSRRFSDRAVAEKISRLSDSLSRFTVPIFILHLEYRGDTLNLAYQSGLERISSRSGGSAVICRTNDEISPGLDSLLEMMKSTYFVGVENPGGKKNMLRVRVEASDDEGNPFSRLSFINQVALRQVALRHRKK